MTVIDQLRRIALNEVADIVDSLPPMAISPQVLARAMRTYAKLADETRSFASVLRDASIDAGDAIVDAPPPKGEKGEKR